VQISLHSAQAAQKSLVTDEWTDRLTENNHAASFAFIRDLLN